MNLSTQRNFGRSGLTLPEVLLVAAFIILAALFLLMRLPRGREQARATACLSNLNQIGQSLGFYVESNGAFPANEPWPAPAAKPGSSVLTKLRDQGDLSSFVDVRAQVDPATKRKKDARPAVPAGLRCPADRASGTSSATSYRANAGSEPAGSSGPFAIGKRVTPGEVDAADGLAFTAAFAERLIGTATGPPGPSGYVNVETCADLTSERLVSPGADASWARDAGHDWSRGDWVMTLYHHGLRPNAPVSAVASKENCAMIGSSSGHRGLVHVLLLDGSARAWRDTVDIGVWGRLGNFSDAAPPR